MRVGLQQYTYVRQYQDEVFKSMVAVTNMTYTAAGAAGLYFSFLSEDVMVGDKNIYDTSRLSNCTCSLNKN